MEAKTGLGNGGHLCQTIHPKESCNRGNKSDGSFAEEN